MNAGRQHHRTDSQLAPQALVAAGERFAASPRNLTKHLD